MLRKFFLCLAGVKPKTIGGIRLLPLSPWHIFRLRVMRNPYVCGTGYRLFDLINAVVVCSHSRADAPQGWALVWAQRKARRAIERHGELMAHIEMTDWIKRGTDVPDHWAPVGELDKPLRAPWEIHLVFVLCHYYGIPYSKAWDFPAGEARCLSDAVAEQNGDKSLVSQEEVDLAPELFEGSG